MSFAKVLQLAAKFAQKMSAQPADIHYALQRARLLGTASMVSPLLERAQIPGHTVADIKLVVSPGPIAAFNTSLNPNHEGANQKLTQLLNARFARPINEALQNAKLNVDGPVSMDWLQITRLGQ